MGKLSGMPVTPLYLKSSMVETMNREMSGIANDVKVEIVPVWPDWAIYWTFGKFLKPLATINLPKSPTLLGNFCKSVKIYHFSREIIFGQLFWHLAIFSGHTVSSQKNPVAFSFKLDTNPRSLSWTSYSSAVQPFNSKLLIVMYVSLPV